jgi:hypothetical protein
MLPFGAWERATNIMLKSSVSTLKLKNGLHEWVFCKRILFRLRMTPNHQAGKIKLEGQHDMWPGGQVSCYNHEKPFD